MQGKREPHRCHRLIQDGTIINQSELTHYGQISTTRMTQIMWMDNLAPDIQEEISFLPNTVKGRDPIKEADIRPIAKTLDWKHQRKLWGTINDSQPVNPDRTWTVWSVGRKQTAW